MRLVNDSGIDIPYEQCALRIRCYPNREYRIVATCHGEDFGLAAYATKEETLEALQTMRNTYAMNQKFFYF